MPCSSFFGLYHRHQIQFVLYCNSEYWLSQTCNSLRSVFIYILHCPSVIYYKVVLSLFIILLVHVLAPISLLACFHKPDHR